MHRFAFAAVGLVLLATACASPKQQARPAAVPVETTSAEIGKDPRWTPPDESGVALDEEKLDSPRTGVEPGNAASPQNTMKLPNAHEQDKVHAAPN
jgi:hypothetical protein